MIVRSRAESIAATAQRYARDRSILAGIDEVKDMANREQVLLDHAAASLIVSARDHLPSALHAPMAAGIVLNAGADVFAVQRLVDDWPRPEYHTGPGKPLLSAG